MQILNDYRLYPPAARGGVLCIGNFDGVHIGHAKMLETGRQEAKRHQLPFTIMTFEPHPFAILRPTVLRPPLTTMEQRKGLLAAFAPDVLLIVPPTKDFLAITAEAFLAEIVQGIFASKILVEGPTFNFGRGAKGSVAMLQEMGTTLGFETIVVPTQEVVLSDLTVVKVSSSLIRWLVENGRVADVTKSLGRPYAMRGEVIKGAQRGRTIGFPTANVAVSQLLPAAGIYAGRAIVNAISYRAAISVGNNPTFEQKHTTVEAYLLDFNSDIYGKTITVEFHRWLREMITYSGIDPLVKQIHRDVAETRETVLLEKSA